MKKLMIGLAMVLAAQGCTSSSSRQISLQDGSQAYRIECKGMSPCYDKAGSLCGGKGYSVVEQSGGPGEDMTTLIVRCR